MTEAEHDTALTAHLVSQVAQGDIYANSWALSMLAMWGGV